MKAKRGRPLSLTDKLTFGKHKGRTVAAVMDVDPNYLHWALDEADGFELNKETMDLLPDREYDEDYAAEFYDIFLSDLGDR